MQGTRIGIAVISAISGLVVLAGATDPSALAQTQPGLWEISGSPGIKDPVRQCVPSVAALAQFEHRGQTCLRRVVSSDAVSTVIEYSCGSAGFGRSKVDVITPRSLRIETQGISTKLPFSYVLQAHRIADCPQQPAARH